jgi:hypothetical protein
MWFGVSAPIRTSPFSRFELGVHDLVLLGWVLARLELTEGRQRQLAAEDRVIETHGFAGVVAEAQVRVKANGHGGPP